jgi:hypothetical protein
MATGSDLTSMERLLRPLRRTLTADMAGVANPSIAGRRGALPSRKVPLHRLELLRSRNRSPLSLIH